MKFTYSVIITTYNRAERLQRLLKTLQGINFPPDGDIIVVNNNSNDNTETIIQEFKEKMPVPLFSFFEKKQGISAARNRAAQESDRNYLIIIDDDAIPCRNWIEEYKKALEEYPIQAANGRIINQWPDNTDKKPWFPEKFPVSTGELRSSEKIKKLSTPQLAGGNLLIQKLLLRKIPFNSNVGRGSSIQGGEDNILALKLGKAGIRTWFIPEAEVFHINEQERDNQSYWYRAAWTEGYSQAYIERKYSSFNKCKIIKRIAALKFFSFMYLVSYFSPSKKFFYKCKIIKQAAMLASWYRN